MRLDEHTAALQHDDLRVGGDELKVQSTDYRMLHYKLQTTNYKVQTTNYTLTTRSLLVGFLSTSERFTAWPVAGKIIVEVGVDILNE